MDRIYYTCKNCNWKSSILAQWADLRPKRCPTKNCNTSFVKHPEALMIEHSNASDSAPVADLSNLDLGQDSSDVLEKPSSRKKAHAKQ